MTETPTMLEEELLLAAQDADTLAALIGKRSSLAARLCARAKLVRELLGEYERQACNGSARADDIVTVLHRLCGPLPTETPRVYVSNGKCQRCGPNDACSACAVPASPSEMKGRP